VKPVTKFSLILSAQIALAFALVHWVGGPLLRGEPLPWQRERVTAAQPVGELGPLLAIDGILVNVAETQGRRFFRTSLSVEMDGTSVEKEAADRLPVLRGKVIDLLSRKSMEQLVEPTARDTLRLELLETLNAEVSTGGFRDIYFTEFLVQ